MNLLFVVPDKEKDLGNLEFGGPEQASREDKKRVGRQEVVVQRRYKLFSDVQRADDIEVVIPAQAGEKYFDYGAGAACQPVGDGGRLRDQREWLYRFYYPRG